ncbi:TetR/AcrR family transcriptional regulator [Arthrobacter zhaoguopingii]|uniref:TetR/AcrR family transcriptional regulator n=1 Tax=Arthrobacter zhaoguopingii TaxID=2681491 RepID=UPI00135C32FE|nr:TetR/AcrR family transcriptional regulator [Arthrobacter zhaoguopingii]
MGRPRKFLETDVVHSAGKAFSDHGYGGTTLEDLVGATGLGKQSLYNAFGGKRELFLRALSSDTADAVAALDEELGDSTATPLERIRGHLIKLAITLSDGGDKGVLFTKATVELAGRDADVTQTALQGFRDLEGIYRQCIIDAQDGGEVDEAADATALASFFVALTRGMEVLGGAGVSRTELTAVALTSIKVLPVLGEVPA